MGKSFVKFMTICLMLVLVVSTLNYCSKASKEQKEAAKIPIDLNLLRLDRIFFESVPENFDQLRTQYPLFFSKKIPDSVFINKLTDPLYRELYSEVKKTFEDDDDFVKKIYPTLQLIKYYFPDVKLPKKIVTLVSDMDYDNKVIFSDSLLIVSLDLYLGSDHKFYDDFYDYQKQNFRKEMLLSDLVSDFSSYVIEPNKDRTLIAHMIFQGKELYLKDILLPNTLDSDKIGYTQDQLAWCLKNEEEIWRYFMNENLLFDTSFHVFQRFMEPGPFSKFYMAFDNETPPRIGSWVGWQIVKRFMKNNNYSLEALLQMEPKTIFELSKYKP